LYSPPIIIKAINSRKMRWGGHVACKGQITNAYKILVGIPKSKRPCINGKIT
jgi:hypothetical protein